MADTRESLHGALRAGRVAHAYLLGGDGKLAQEAAAFLLCESAAEQKPCGACAGCTLAQAGTHPDLLHVSPTAERATARPAIKIDAVRALQEELAKKSIRHGYRVVLIEQAHTMTAQAQNALLKTLEEPPEGIVFFLIGDPAALLPTVRSRCVLLRIAEVTQGDAALKARALESAHLLLEKPSALLPFYQENKTQLEWILLWQSVFLRDALAEGSGVAPLGAALLGVAPLGVSERETVRVSRAAQLAAFDELQQARMRLRLYVNPALLIDALVVRLERILAKELPARG